MTPDDDIREQRYRLYLRDTCTIFFAVLIIGVIDTAMIVTHQISP
jgi:hypothetical protein